MVENGGELSVGKRLERIEIRLDEIERHLDARITRHKRANEDTITELANSVIKSFGERIGALEAKEQAEDAVNAALAAAKTEALSNKRWVIGVGVIGGGGLLINAILLINVLKSVN